MCPDVYGFVMALTHCFSNFAWVFKVYSVTCFYELVILQPIWHIFDCSIYSWRFFFKFIYSLIFPHLFKIHSCSNCCFYCHSDVFVRYLPIRYKFYAWSLGLIIDFKLVSSGFHWVPANIPVVAHQIVDCV